MSSTQDEFEAEPPTTESSQSREGIFVSRQTIHLVGWILPVIAITSFVFGLMVGTVTAPKAASEPFAPECELRITIDRASLAEPDAEIVVMLLPDNRPPDRRLEPDSILPGQFQPIDNPVLKALRETGAAISRTNGRGEVSLRVQAEQSYTLVVLTSGGVLNAGATPDGSQVWDRSQLAAVSAFFLPVERLFSKGPTHIEKVLPQGDMMTLGPIAFVSRPRQ